MGDANQLSGNYQVFGGGGLSYTFDGYTPINIDLTSDEAKFIKDKIIASSIAKDSFWLLFFVTTTLLDLPRSHISTLETNGRNT